MSVPSIGYLPEMGFDNGLGFAKLSLVQAS